MSGTSVVRSGWSPTQTRWVGDAENGARWEATTARSAIDASAQTREPRPSEKHKPPGHVDREWR
ncbi:MAG: hypothetical protein EHM77_01800 [Planctomycetaceae bacterium]|nr:MAG: hypothetical protein EHM77_01800 [Planctomycetaceae bacterium]